MAVTAASCALALLVTSTSAYAQLRIVGTSGTRDFAATRGPGAEAASGAAGEAPAYSISALAQLGATVSSDNGFVTVDLFGETIRFAPRSPFFRSDDAVYQLAFATRGTTAALEVPEQFFIQWLPSHFASNVEYRDGALRLRTDVVVTKPSNTNGAPGTGAVTRPGSSASPGRSSASRKRIVVIDPGHGGIDSGATGPNGLEEKAVCLMIANRLAALLRTRGYEVHLTRTADTLISLADRPRFANQWKGDEPGALYISIHNNSLKTAPSAHGFETFFLADANTSDERRVADMENAAVKYEKNTRPVGSDLDQVLNGLRNDFYLRASNAFADVVQKGLSQFHPGPNRGVKRAGFRVLIGALMPAVLVEVGFISNPQEEALLGSAGFQDKLAYSLAESVDAFFRDNEPLWIRQ
jgi:N-acetylmuramoyl-L-alanine amidase